MNKELLKYAGVASVGGYTSRNSNADVLPLGCCIHRYGDQRVCGGITPLISLQTAEIPIGTNTQGVYAHSGHP